MFILFLALFRHTVENLEDLSSTDLKQEWGKLKNEKRLYEKATPISDFCHMGSSSSKSSLDSRLAGSGGANVLDVLISGAEGSELELTLRTDIDINPVQEENIGYDYLLQLSLCHGIVGNNNILPRFQNYLKSNVVLAENAANFYSNNVCVSYEDSVRLCLETVAQAGTVWKDARAVRITGSNCYSFFTYSQNKNPDWTLKVSRLLKSSFKGNKATLHGKRFESTALEAYELAFGCKVERLGIIVPPSAPWLGASLDGVSGKHCIEVKCPLTGKNKTATDVVEGLNYLTGSVTDNTLKLKTNHQYYGQVQLQMLLSGLKICHFIIYASYDNSFIGIEIPFDAKFTADMLQVLRYVYFANVLPILCEMNA